MYMMRFDLRARDGSSHEQYAAAIEMAAWGEANGALAVALSEHHGSDDGYLPSPLLYASAVAARTSTIPIVLAAVLLPLHDPVRLAEDMVVLDLVSAGRVSYVLGLGYRPEEFEMFDVPMRERGRRADANLELLLEAVTGEPFEHGGRTIHVTPKPHTPGGPSIAWGGGSIAAAKRAGRFGVDFMAQNDEPGMIEAYVEEAKRAGHEPGNTMLVSPSTPTNVFVADDLDEAWREIGPYLLHDARMYAAWNPNTRTANISRSTTIDALRTENMAHRIVTVDGAIELIREHGVLQLHPMCGGIPPDVAWPYLARVVDEVLPKL